MKLLSYGLDYRMEPRLAFSLRGQAIDVMRASLWMKEDRNAQDYLNLASSMKLALEDWPRCLSLLTQLEEVFQHVDTAGLTTHNRLVAMPEDEIIFFASIPDPPSVRFFNAFTNSSPQNYVFGQTQTLLGHNQELPTGGLSGRAELAAIVTTHKNGGQAEIAGFSIVNNWVDLKQWTQGYVGPALGQATSLGPYLLTSDEVENLRIGAGLNMDLQVRIDGQTQFDGRFKEMSFSFEDMLNASHMTGVSAGDVLCSGSPQEQDVITGQGKKMEIEVQALGTLTSRLV